MDHSRRRFAVLVERLARLNAKHLLQGHQEDTAAMLIADVDRPPRPATRDAAERAINEVTPNRQGHCPRTGVVLERLPVTIHQRSPTFTKMKKESWHGASGGHAPA